MGARTTIEWTGGTWNWLRGCTMKSEGCQNCYAAQIALRFSGPGKPFEGLARMTPHGPRWTGVVRFVPEKWDEPLHWKEPRMIFVNSVSDTFHETVPFEWIDQAFAIMALTPQHTYQILTKRPERMAEYFNSRAATGWDKAEGKPHEDSREMSVYRAWCSMAVKYGVKQQGPLKWPLPNVWVGTSTENQKTADERIPHLLKVPAVVRFLSCEPLLGPLELTNVRVSGTGESGDYANALSLEEWTEEDAREEFGEHFLPTVDWVIAGGESGPGARPMHPEWVRSIRDQCQAAGVPFLFKQWGAYAPQIAYGMTWEDKAGQLLPMRTVSSTDRKSVGELTYHAMPPGCKTGPGKVEVMRKVGKKAAGRLLDGRIHNEFPHMREEGRTE